MCAVTWIAVWKTPGRFMVLTQSFWEWIFLQEALYELGEHALLLTSKPQRCSSAASGGMVRLLYLIQVSL